ncbi:flagellar assembly peptidoglycan hydrolase FlgJ [Agrilutibacter solisilvae]|uniref:Peptidoglycan hydrolase FlgJ n=1 Tax=Agrilutibacter solisilvae TaxID=2763317 RepID=A0A974XXG9_9GAMM|nr:flagellar assembly peptidoglycan hydrolase FlgJ [Lysobacter solisilvae]QSX77621.1 flagellar assembly peptidoglycan hydrolase FlgJ [Lysobacter solisilvae]
MRLPSTHAIALEPAQGSSRSRIEQAARELETQFAQMLIKSMRSATPGDPMLGGNTTYREMYDQQLARELGKGRGLGLAPMIVRQLERSTQQAASATTTPSSPTFLPLARPAAPMPLAAPVSVDLSASPLALAPTRSGVSMPAFAAVAPTFDTPPAPSTQPACDPNAPLDCSSPEAFVRSIWPHAQKTAAELGVPAKALVAQAALETGWGRRLVKRGGETSHNLFGIKAGSRWSGQRMSASTHEFTNGVRHTERADFRAYGSAADSFADYARLLGKDRYAGARGTGDDTQRFASALQKAGYATDPSYAAKITAIANGATLNRALAAVPAVAMPGTAVATASHSTVPRG